jgi:hypothetical protein
MKQVQVWIWIGRGDSQRQQGRRWRWAGLKRPVGEPLSALAFVAEDHLQGKKERLEAGAVVGAERKQEVEVMDSCVEAEDGGKGLEH